MLNSPSTMANMYQVLQHYILQSAHSVYRENKEECAIFRENVPWVNLHRPDQTYLHQKLNGYGSNDAVRYRPLAVPRTLPV